MKSGFVSIIGRPNVGKSTLLNAIIGKKIAITSDTAQTTRNMIQGIYNDKDLQIVFVDTPGIHKPKHKLGTMLNEQAYFSMNDVDVILFLVSANEKFGTGDKFVLDKLKEVNKPIILVINKIDKIKYDELLPMINEYKDYYPFKEIVPISAINNNLTDNIKYYDDNIITNVSTDFSISELIREKVLYFTYEEIPHSVSCIVDNIEEDKNNVSIGASLIVDRDNLKKILIGKNGSMIKKIGINAREDIEKLLNKKDYIDLRVKVIENWRDKESFLSKELGLNNFNE